MKKILFFLLIFPNLCFSADYHIGPDQSYPTIASFNWPSLSAGDHVYIHYAIYKEMIWLSGVGSESNPIVIEGVPDDKGRLPVLDGDNMIIPPSYDGHLSKYDASGDGKLAQGYGMIFIHWSNTVYGTSPKWITIKNFEIKSNTPESYSFTNTNGVVQQYPNGNAGVYIKTGENITLENLIIHDTGNGVECQGVDAMVKNLTVRSSHLYDFGRTDGRKFLEHGVYTEASSLVLEYNIIGPPRDGTSNSAIKSRGADTIIRHNVIYSGSRTIDLVEPENQSSYECDGTGHVPGKMHDEPGFENSWVYGNLFINRKIGTIPSAAYLMHYGYDNCPDLSRNGNLNFYNNTVIHDIDASDSWNSALFDIAPLGTVNVRNNLVLSLGDTNFHIAYHSKSTKSGTYNMDGGNWITSGYTNVRSGYTAVFNENVPILKGDNTGVVVNSANQGLPGLPLINGGITLPSSWTLNHDIDKQYTHPRTYTNREDISQIGAMHFYTEQGAPMILNILVK
ncbi:hypothetical protein [Desulfosediminicola flagellatus]|uniref:hypothetical protein n=1 Tax=Desulfosediminicola flagellatus TaxID=2569541 RepID=UPI0010AC4176|nr:hypothetical protein [Desulfosediminicola flagellatus]